MRRPPVQLDGSLSVVTGAATALALARRGSRVISADLDLEGASRTAARCKAVTAGAAALEVDVADRGAVDELAAHVIAEHGVPDVLVNNAGVGMSGRLLDGTVEDWAWIRSINLDGVVHGCTAFGPAMTERGRGHVVNMSSGLGYTPRATEISYCTTKAAVLMFSRCLRADWSASGVGVTAVCPGIINTPIIGSTRFLAEQEGQRAAVQKTFRRGHKPERVADAVVAAVERNRAVAPVGWESHLGWWANRLAPLRTSEFVARQDVSVAP